MGIFEDNLLWEKTCREAANEKPRARAFCSYFASILVNGKPPDPAALFDMFVENLTRKKQNETDHAHRQRALCRLEFYLRHMNSSCE
jgi:hypothetical protein